MSKAISSGGVATASGSGSRSQSPEGMDHRRRAVDQTHQRGAVMTRVLLDLDAFFLEHRLCGDLDTGTTDERVWLTCVACGARIVRGNPASEEHDG